MDAHSAPTPAPTPGPIAEDFLFAKRAGEAPAPADEAARLLALAKSHVQSGDLPAAADAAAEAVRLAPKSHEAHALLGAVRLELGELFAAFEHLRQAAELHPTGPSAWLLAGEAALQTGDLETARSHLTHGLTLRPDTPAAVARLGEVYLKAGDYAAGLTLFERRENQPAVPAVPRWDGRADVSDRTVLVLAEREVSDLVQFVRYAGELQKKGAKVWVSCPEDLVGLIETVPGVARALPFEAPIPPADFQIPLLSLPAAFGTTRATVPADVPYLPVDPGLLADWEGRLGQYAPDHFRRVGLLWADAGDPSPARTRSAALADLEPLWRVPNVAWFGLQQGPPREELPFCATPLADLSAEMTSPADILAAVSAVDLLISVDTPALHAAGAAGRPAVGLLSTGCDWRWGATGDTTPWYPTVRLFRQERFGEWEPVARRVAEALHQWVKTQPAM